MRPGGGPGERSGLWGTGEGGGGAGPPPPPWQRGRAGRGGAVWGGVAALIGRRPALTVSGVRARRAAGRARGRGGPAAAVGAAAAGLAAAGFVSVSVRGQRRAGMDTLGRKVVVCDNGTGVSRSESRDPPCRRAGPGRGGEGEAGRLPPRPPRPGFLPAHPRAAPGLAAATGPGRPQPRLAPRRCPGPARAAPPSASPSPRAAAAAREVGVGPRNEWAGGARRGKTAVPGVCRLCACF